MEQALINQLICLLCKSGGAHFVGNFQKSIDKDGVHEVWTEQEIKEAVEYVKYINEYFGKGEAVAVLTNLAARYNIELKDILLAKPQGLASEQ